MADTTTTTNSEGPKTAAQLGTATDLTCELCSKSYQRRNLLIRHRRRCQGPSKPQNKRKACDACVAAKTRCCYSQPTCSRCAKRGTPCVYASKAATSASTDSAHDSAMDLSEPSEGHGTPASTTAMASGARNSFSLTTTAESLDMPLWDTTMTSSWPLEPFDLSLPTAMQPPVSIAGFGMTVPSDTPMTNDLPIATDFTFFQSDGIAGLQSPPSAGVVSLPTTSWNLPLSSLGMQIAPLSSNLPTSAQSSPPPASSVDAVRLLGDYPTKVLSEEFATPFLHRTLYSDAVPDMTSLPLSSMAICCGSGVDTKNSMRFIRRAIDAERQRLIEAFPSYQCMQQWDALHAMLLYEVLELRESLDDELETWKHKPRVKGLRSPFLLKMTQCYARSYPAIRNPDIKIFSDPSSAPTSTVASSWARWRITETARRTFFFANIVNFYINRNRNTGEQLPYYEPLDDELILNMPLPCSEAAWTASDEPAWMVSIQTDPSPLALHLASEVSPSGGPPPEVTLKTIFSKYNKNYIQQEFVRSVGFNDSDKLRGLIILCACEQFT